MAINQDAMTSEEIENTITDYLFPEDVEEKQPSEEEVAESPEVETEDVDDTEEVEEETVGEDKEVEEDQEEEDSSERWMPESLDDLAAAMEVEPDDLKSIRVKTKVDGVEGEATLAEVIKNYQINKSLTERSETFAQERKQFQEQQQQVLQAYEEKIAAAESMTQVIEERLKSEVAAIDWDQLKREDPAQYAIHRQDYMEKIGEVENMKNVVMQQRQEQAQKQQQDWVAQHQQILQYNQEQLMTKAPEWRDADVMKKEMGELRSYLQNQDISDQEINGIVDHRMVLLARKAKAYDEMQTNAKPAKARAKTKPKFTKPGSLKTKQNSESALAKKRIQRASKSQNVDDWSKVLEDRLFS